MSAAIETSSCERRRRSRHSFTSIPTVFSGATPIAVMTVTMSSEGRPGNDL
jgi:hypothetical protein